MKLDDECHAGGAKSHSAYPTRLGFVLLNNLKSNAALQRILLIVLSLVHQLRTISYAYDIQSQWKAKGHGLYMLGEVILLPPLAFCKNLNCASIVILASCSLAQKTF